MMDDVMNFLKEDNADIDSVTLSPADESAIFLTALQDTCTEEEYNDLVMEHASELALYGLIDDSNIVTEAQKITYKLTKQSTFSREQKRAALRLARKADCTEWKLYHKYRTLMIEQREKIYAKFGSKAKSEAKKVMQNSKRKASSMNSVTGKTIADRMDKKIKEMSN